MRNIFTIALACVALAVITSAASADRLATYDPGTGNITLSGLLAGDIGLDVKSSDNDLIAGNANANGAIFDSSLAPGTISWLNFGGLTASGDFDAGDVLPAGKPSSGTPALDAVQGLSIFIIPGLGQTGIQINTVGVPEPTTLGLAGLGLIGLVVRRRR